MDPLVGGTIAQGAANIGTGIIDNLFSKRNVKIQTEANKELADYAYGKDLEMWHLQNLYNSPKSQMQRFQEAGLNPNLIYGKGTSGNAVSMPKAQQTKAERHQVKVPDLQMLSMYQNLAQGRENIQKTKTESAVNREHAISLNTNSTLNQTNAAIKDLELRWKQGANTSWNAYGGNYYQGQKIKLQTAQAMHQLSVKRNDLLNAQIDYTLSNLYRLNRQNRFIRADKFVGYGSQALRLINPLSKVGQKPVHFGTKFK